MVKIVSSKPYVAIRPGWNIDKLAMPCQKWSHLVSAFSTDGLYPPPWKFTVAWVDLVQGYILHGLLGVAVVRLEV